MSENPLLSGACDCHVHVIGPHAIYPLEPIRSYTPMPATAQDLIAMMQRVGLSRAVIVQPSVLGLDNRCTLDALPKLREAGLEGRAVAVLAENTSCEELDRLHQIGVRGIRVNLQSHATGDLQQARLALAHAAKLCERHGWHVQLYVDRQTILFLRPDIERLPVMVVLDHFGGLSVEQWEDPASQAILDLLANDRVYIKLSGTYRVTEDPFDPRLSDLAQHLARINVDRLVWASDWPHTPRHQGKAMRNPPVQPYRDMDTKRLFCSVQHWLDDVSCQKVLVANPATLYGFAS